MQSLQDFSTFMAFVPRELQRAIIDARTNQVTNGNGTPPNLLGILNVSGTLTRSQGGDTPLDCIRKAMNDLRTGSAFADANLMITHPNTWADLQLQKSTTGTYLLSPNDPNAIGNLNEAFGVRVVTNTHCAAGTAIVLDSRQAIYAWTRHGLTLDTNSTGTDPNGVNLWTQNAVSFRAEGRWGLGYPRPTAINIVTGLPT
jgi:HK97 family phage major capsid protein